MAFIIYICGRRALFSKPSTLSTSIPIKYQIPFHYNKTPIALITSILRNDDAVEGINKANIGKGNKDPLRLLLKICPDSRHCGASSINSSSHPVNSDKSITQKRGKQFN